MLSWNYDKAQLGERLDKIYPFFSVLFLRGLNHSTHCLQLFAATSVYDRCVEAATGLLLPGQKSENRYIPVTRLSL